MNLPNNILSQLREATPDRPITFNEARSVAERQALKLLHLGDIDGPRMPETLITELPRLRVSSDPDLPTSGLSHYHRGLWRIVVNASEARVRQRFTLAHEFKHILDHPFAATLYAELTPAQVERVCDYFAGCLLIPRPQLKRAWTAGIQTTSELARRFDVSTQAMAVRLQQTGTVDRHHRCASYFRVATPLAVAA